MTNKTKAELEESRSNWKFWCIVLIGCTIYFLVLFIYFGIKSDDLMLQLQECQENVETWTLRAECYYPELNAYNYMEINFTDYEEYLENKEEGIEDKYCKIIK